MSQLLTYSGLAVNCTLQSGLFGSVQFGGISQTGLASIAVRMTVDHASIQYGIDGAAVPSYQAGEGGEIDVEIYQTSTTQQEFLAAYNAVLTASLLGDVSQSFGGQLLIFDTATGASHLATGLAFTKFADKPYQEQAQRVRWLLKACNIINQ